MWSILRKYNNILSLDTTLQWVLYALQFLGYHTHEFDINSCCLSWFSLLIMINIQKQLFVETFDIFVFNRTSM